MYARFWFHGSGTLLLIISLNHAATPAQGFYEAYYHPSNARFWFYGDDPSEERLRIVDAYLQVPI